MCADCSGIMVVCVSLVRVGMHGLMHAPARTCAYTRASLCPHDVMSDCSSLRLRISIISIININIIYIYRITYYVMIYIMLLVCSL